jgi:hypothetical protein
MKLLLTSLALLAALPSSAAQILTPTTTTYGGIVTGSLSWFKPLTTTGTGYFLLPMGVPNNTTSPRLSGRVVLGGP